MAAPLNSSAAASRHLNPAPLSLLSLAQIERLHDASLRILENCGLVVEDPDMRDLLARHGCLVRDRRVLFSRDLVATAISGDHHRRIPLRNPLTGQGFVLEPGTVRTHSTGGAPWIVDAKTGERRNANSSDMIDALRLMNQLEHVDLPCCLFFPADIPAPINQYVQAENMFRYCKKPIYAPGVSTVGNAKYVAELFRLFNPGNGEYAGIIGISPESPLHLPREITDVMQVMVKAGVPVGILAAPMAGLTGPVTLGGCVAQCHAEILAFASLAYLIRPQTPLIFSYRPFFCNMKMAQAILGLPENGLASALCAQLANYCGFLSDVYGLSCSSYDFDEQSGYEKMYNGLLPALAGASLITGFGSLASVLCGSLAQLVLDNELFGMVRRTGFSISLDDESLGLDAIGNVAWEDSNFMVEDHTILNMRAPEVYTPVVGFDRTVSFEHRSEPALLERAAQRAADLLALDEPLSWTPEISTEVAAIRRAAEQELL